MSLSDSITSLRTMLDSCASEVKSLENGRRASSCRSRLHLQNIKKSCHILRKDIMEHSKKIPVKKRQPKKVVVETVEVAEVTDEPVKTKKQVKPKKKVVKSVEVVE
jgi:hypothetical protein